ncbi:unnamed protein product [Schistosoma margrebowiei]|uniref:Uncharacterized protein n=1 Tax=Schistosoma margrebowiei TaxID=48269 RepID=A0A183MXP3_9TREM|nr:unnamed protein product [Schistosoma margrebowiei]
MAFLSNTHQQMQMKATSVSAASASIGFKIHKGNSKTLKDNTKNVNPITLDGEILDDVESFMYLGSLIDE